MNSIFTDSLPAGFLERFKKHKWYRHGIYRDWGVLSLCARIYSGPEWFAKEGISKGIDNQAEVMEPTFLDEDEFDELVALFRARIEKGGLPYLKYYIERHTRDNEALIKVSEEIRSHDHSAADAQALAADFEALAKAMHETCHWLWSLEFLNPPFDEYVRAQLMRAKPDLSAEQANELLSHVAIPRAKIFFQEEKEAILEADLNDEAEIRRLHETYAWLKINFWNGLPYSYDEYALRVRSMKNDPSLMKQVQELNDAMRRADSLIKEESNKEIRELLEVLQDLIYLKTWRIDSYSISKANALPFFDEIARRLGVTHEELLLMTEHEVPAALTGSPIPNDISRRVKHVEVVLEGKLHFFYGKAVEEIEKVLYDKDYSSVRELRGTVGYKGVVRGIARVLLTDRELGKLQKGDILVANLTNPNYDPAFGVIAGVVTDEDGILCHSAIMAREFKIPCVIGTKIATRVLKDGDMVEVDANLGVVRLIKD